MADVDSTLAQWSTTASSNKPADATSIGSGLGDNLRTIEAVVRAYLAHYNSVAIASSGTTDLGGNTGLVQEISGTTTITSLGTISAGIWKIVRFQGALTLTHNATSLILPGGASITTAAGDYMLAYSKGSGNWVVPFYQRASGSPWYSAALLGTAIAALTADTTPETDADYIITYDDSATTAKKVLINDILQMPVGQCQLAFSSTSELLLNPYNGNRLFINGRLEIVPSAGVSLANTGLTAATLYYIYAYMSGGTMTLAASTTGYATNTTYGHMVKSDNNAYTLVGMAYMDSGTPGTFADSNAKRYTRSYYNDPGFSSQTAFTTARTAPATLTEVHTEIRINFVAWASEIFMLSIGGLCSLATTNGCSLAWAPAIDGTKVGFGGLYYKGGFTGGVSHGCEANTPYSAAEGFHYATLFGQYGTDSGSGFNTSSTLSLASTRVTSN